MKYLLFVFVVIAVCGDARHEAVAKQTHSTASAPKIAYSGGDGSSMDQAVVIENAKDETDGEEAEYAWVRKKFPGFKFKSKGLVKRGDKKYDHVFGTKADGTDADFYFDITLLQDKT